MFHAFLSYSHRADAKLAALLQRALERLGTPWWRRAAVRVFRDDATLSASAALWSSIEAGLQRSAYFVLLASPAAATSPWVDREVRWWLEQRPRDRLLLVPTSGDIAYDSAARDFDWRRTDCLPPALRGVFTTEPLWVDLRFAAALPVASLRHTRLRSAALGLAAAVRGIDKDELESEDLRVHRRSIAVAGGAAVTIVVLGLVAAAALFTARTESNNARVNRLQAESRRLAADALVDLARGGPGIEGAIFKAALAWRLAPTEESRAALGRINDSTAAVARVLGTHTAGAYKVSLSPDGRVLATAGREGAVLRWDVASGAAAGVPMAGQGWPDRLVHSADGTHLLLQTHERVENVDRHRLWLFRLGDGASLPLGTAWEETMARSRPAWRGGGGLCSALSADGALLAMADENVVLVLRIADGALAEHRLSPRLRVAALGFSNRGVLLLMAKNQYGDGAHAARIDDPARAGSPLRLGPRDPRAETDCRYASVSADGRRIAGRGGAWQVDDGLRLARVGLPAAATHLAELTGHHAPELDAAGRLMAVGSGGIGTVWNLDTHKLVLRIRKQDDSHGPPLTLSADGSVLAGLQDGTPVVWALGADGPARALPEGACGQRGVLTPPCLVRLCERLTSRPDAKRWRELLGDGHADLMQAAAQLDCGRAAPTER